MQCERWEGVGGSVVTPSYSQVKRTRKVKPLPNVEKGKTYIYRVSQEECARLREGVPYVKVH